MCVCTSIVSLLTDVPCNFTQDLSEDGGGGLLRRLTRAQQLCHACKVVRPPRSKHCRVCRRCCAVMDHHCPFIGNCVGVGNYRWFLAYVVNVL